MTTQTMRSKDAARPRPRNTTPTSKPAGSAARSPAGERLRKEALATVAANIARIDAAESGAAPHADHNEQGAQQPAQPAPDERKQNVPDPARKGGKREKQQGAGTKPVKPAKAPKAKRLSCLDAAAQVIGKDPIGCKDLIAEMGVRKLWSSPNGKTPEASLYAAIIREISAKGSEARFRKVDRGLFVANSAGRSGGKGA